MADSRDLDRFLDAQSSAFDLALSELRHGLKEGHWMWFVFPQLAALGRSGTAKFYGIDGADEAEAYLRHPVLGPRLRQSVEAILAWSGKRSADQIFGALDAMKLRSSLTLFDAVEPNGIFASGLSAFFHKPDLRTLALLNEVR